jgi:hypothetical protein
MKQTIVSELLTRLKSESPTLFKRLQALFFGLAAIVVVLILIQPLGFNLHGFEVYTNWNTVMVLLGFAGVNMLPVSNPKVLSEDAPTDPDKPRPKPGQ